jgi:pectin methylesterase-like acyl-CoA thioesterase
MRARLVIAIAALALPLVAATKDQKQKSQDEGVAQAIAFEKAKDAADARQARIEGKHPTVFYKNSDDQNANREVPPQKIPDSGETQPQERQD